MGLVGSIGTAHSNGSAVGIHSPGTADWTKPERIFDSSPHAFVRSHPSNPQEHRTGIRPRAARLDQASNEVRSSAAILKLVTLGRVFCCAVGVDCTGIRESREERVSKGLCCWWWCWGAQARRLVDHSLMHGCAVRPPLDYPHRSRCEATTARSGSEAHTYTPKGEDVWDHCRAAGRPVRRSESGGKQNKRAHFPHAWDKIDVVSARAHRRAKLPHSLSLFPDLRWPHVPAAPRPGRRRSVRARVNLV